MLQSTSTTAKQQQVDSQKNTTKKFSLQEAGIKDKAKSEDNGGELQKERENQELNSNINREINKAFLDSKTQDNVIRYKESVAKFRNSIKVAFSDDVKNDYQNKNGYIPTDWTV